MTFRSTRRIVAAAAAAVVAASSFVAVPNAAASAGFSDASDAGVHRATVESLTRQGIFRGTECAPGLLCPRDPLPRWAMAVWLVRVLGETDPAPTADSGFVDVDAAEWWAPHVRRLAELGVTKGCVTESARYCPDKSATRAQMASFLTRAFDLAPGPSAGFQDVNPSSTHADAINALAAAGITKGCTAEPARYCPQRPVTRAQMATFLYRAVAREPRIAFVSDMDQDAEIIAADATGTGTRLLTHNFDEDLDPAWSPDGSFMLYSDGVEIFKANSDGTGSRQITDTLGNTSSWDPVLSPDGTRIAFRRSRVYGSIYVIAADGSEPVPVIRDTDRWDLPVWSPDSTRLAYSTGPKYSEGTESTHIAVVNADGDGAEILTSDHETLGEGRAACPAWSPDGTRIAFAGRTGGDSGVLEIWVMDADGARITQLTDNLDSEGCPLWSPDGTQLLYTIYREVDERLWVQEIWVMRSDGSGQRMLAERGESPAWSPDGTRIAYVSDQDGDREIFVMQADGTDQTQLTFNNDEDLAPVWSPLPKG